MSEVILGGVAEFTPQNTGMEIRAHHLELIPLLLNGGVSVSELIPLVQDGAFVLAQERGAESPVGRYYQEVYPNDSVASAFNESAISTYEQFLALLDDAPVWVVDNRKDQICAGCQNDNHCLKPILKDRDYIRATIETASELGIEFTEEQIESVDRFGQVVAITRIGLSAHDAKVIFKDPYFNLRAIPSELERAMAIRALSMSLRPGRQQRSL